MSQTTNPLPKTGRSYVDPQEWETEEPGEHTYGQSRVVVALSATATCVLVLADGTFGSILEGRVGMISGHRVW